jgi:hypothetical protein
VERIVRRDFAAEHVAEVLAMLDEYGAESWQHDPHRVRLAALKLAAGSIERLRYQLETAKRDYRDVLAPAEYPGYCRRVLRPGELPSDEERRIIDDDWTQYQDWLTR